MATKRRSENKLANSIQVQKFLEGVDYPARKQELIDKAIDEGADEKVIHTLESLPDREYTGPIGIAKELGNLK